MVILSGSWVHMASVEPHVNTMESIHDSLYSTRQLPGFEHAALSRQEFPDQEPIKQSHLPFWGKEKNAPRAWDAPITSSTFMLKNPRHHQCSSTRGAVNCGSTARAAARS